MCKMIILNTAIRKVPFLKYALGIVGICAAIAIAGSLGVTAKMIPSVAIGIFINFMVVLFLVARVERSNDKYIKILGKIILTTCTIVSCILAICYLWATIFHTPKSLYDLMIDHDKKNDTILISKTITPSHGSHEISKRVNFKSYTIQTSEPDMYKTFNDKFIKASKLRLDQANPDLYFKFKSSSSFLENEDSHQYYSPPGHLQVCIRNNKERTTSIIEFELIEVSGTNPIGMPNSLLQNEVDSIIAIQITKNQVEIINRLKQWLKN
jgi:hypothetical protein